MPKRLEITPDEALETRKGFANNDGVLFKAHSTPTSYNKDDRSAVFVMSAETEDRHRDVVIQSGIDTEHFEANPIALFNHISRDTPIGNWSDMKIVKGAPARTEGKMTFVEEGIDDTADRVARHIEAKSLRACSIGFRPKKIERIVDDEDRWTYGYKFKEIELMECSVVTIPAVREALMKGNGNVKDIMSPEVIEEFLEHLKSHPAVAQMVDIGLYEGAFQEATGNKSFTIITPKNDALNVEMPGIAEFKDLVERAEKAAGNIASKPETLPDPVSKELEDGISELLEEFSPKIDALEDEDQKSALGIVIDAVKGVFASKEPPKATQETKDALAKRVEEFEERFKDAA